MLSGTSLSLNRDMIDGFMQDVKKKLAKMYSFIWILPEAGGAAPDPENCLGG